MVCRARSGDTAPVLGARLSAETGISGECLRTGKIHHCSDTENDPLVDVEVCRSLGLRSMVVLPIRGWRGVNGIIEVFSTRPAAFTEQHIALLQQLALLAERARASQPHGASSVAPSAASELRMRIRWKSGNPRLCYRRRIASETWPFQPGNSIATTGDGRHRLDGDFAACPGDLAWVAGSGRHGEQGAEEDDAIFGGQYCQRLDFASSRH